MKLAGKVAIVTGTSPNIGGGIAGGLADEGATVVCVDVVADNAAQCAAWITKRGGRALGITCDTTDEAQVQAMVARVSSAHGGVDVLVNNAGINAYFDAATMTETEWDSVFAVDLKGAWLCAKYALESMRRAGRGSIVNISSIHAQLTMPGMFPYAAAKSGLVGLTRSLALDCARQNIRVNAVLPGWTRTRLVEEWFAMQPDPAAAEQSVLDAHPGGRIATPAEIAAVVAFVASDDASAMTGASVSVDCGLGVRFAT